MSLLGIAIGSTDLPLTLTLRVMAAHLLPANWIELPAPHDPHHVIIWLVRTPRILAALLIGAALGIAGAQIQGLFQNPLAAPDIIGTSAGAALGAVFSIASGLAAYSLYFTPFFAFLGALITLFIVFTLSHHQNRHFITTLLLAGIAINAFIGAITSLLITVIWHDHEITREVLFWLMGGLDSRTWSHVSIILPGFLIGLTIALIYTRELDLLSLGTETALSLGVSVPTVQRIIFTNAALLTGMAVAISGIIGFVGLIVPHIVRLLIGPGHRYLIPGSALLGSTFLVTMDLLARTLHRPEEIRLGILTALIGAPFFLYLLLKESSERGLN